ncbi:HAD family hydrolase [Mangrovicella endophytica]|uniref:HAD family hydrolase n=1 Tax=Mangrovicella endophytica TaxID=2066697 RepID=UPI000C9E5943|nr:HAD family phosphatase [Mangrovicella endophytica]
MPALSLVIFDCDGVLVDSEIVAARVEVEMLKEVGIEFEAHEFSTRFAGLTWPRIMELLTEETGVRFREGFAKDTDKAIDEALASSVEMIASAADILERFDQPRCICSNSTTERLKMELQRVELWDRFRPYVFSALEVGTRKGKPAPDVYLYACKEFGVAPREAIVIEDSVHGVTAAAAAGCRVVGFTGASHTYAGHAEALTDAGAETVISRLADFPAVIEAFAEWERA